jgi:hypothetical protein
MQEMKKRKERTVGKERRKERWKKGGGRKEGRVKESRNVKHGAHIMCVCTCVHMHVNARVRVLLVIVEFKTPGAGNKKTRPKGV